ncbi:MAG TPA: NADH-ubiquinone oxidoreductase-F iron-sulfur binding region domain-containing protein [Prolixibacteraceae bacterium]|nr:NADH-ubiquinone oxidoreductase-F iron-sulfur binding region domain-containing protein [Prolixibacteraceae bacterium]
MQRITSPEQFEKLFRELSAQNAEQFKLNDEMVYVCTGGGCIACGSISVKDELEKKLKEHNLDSRIKVKGTGCLGPCSKGPVIHLVKSDVYYQNIQLADIDELVESHFLKGKPVERLMFHSDETGKPIELGSDIKLFNRQRKIVLRRCGTIDPVSIYDYISTGGYSSLKKALTKMNPDQVIDEMKASGLRGRGGAGFPTFMKWSFAKKETADQKYILCNADEGDPGAFMDRSLLEGDPHSIIEGMVIGAFTIGANKGFVYVRAEYPLAVERLNKAMNDARELGLLGENILGTGFSFDLDIRMGSGAFVCGEETALMASIEGKRGEPRPRPPFPTTAGLWGKPTVLNNVETYANVNVIIEKGGDWFAQFGTGKSKGTKIFALTGAIKNSGLYEVPVGTSLGDLVYDIGGGTSSGKPFKAAQIGGPSGGCIPKQHLNVALDYESLNELGAIMGSGGLVVMDEDTCMVDVAKFFLDFVLEESCGKCTPCRVGTKRMYEILDRITTGHGREGDIERLEHLGEWIKKTSLCGLGQSAPNPVLSTIRYFRHEYESHIREHKCEAGVCAKLVRAPCQSACPAGVDVPGFVSLTGEKRYAEALRLHRERNPFAAVCARVCFHTCEDKCRRTTVDAPVSIRGIKRYMVDQEITIQLPEIKENAENAARKIAIVGAGPAGLSCAYFLARLGYKPIVFEAEQRPGGMLVQTIPAYRLPREILAREIRMIENMGVDIRTGLHLGKDFTLESLKEEGFDAVFIGVGSPQGVIPPIPGIESEGVVDALKFLQTYNLRGSVPVGKRIAVIGGGNAAIDAARTAVRLGAESVDIIYRRTQEEMPAWAEEIDAALEEKISLHTLTNPREFVSENGKVKTVRCVRMKLGAFDSSGRRRPVETNDEVNFDVDQVIIATGQTLNVDEILGDIPLKLAGKAQLGCDKRTGQTSEPWIFTGGDAATGPSSVIEAVAGGERAAVGIDEYLTGNNHAFWRKERYNDTFFDPEAEPAKYPRTHMVMLQAERRMHNFDEVELVWPEGEAVRQARRCLRCDYGSNINCI